MLTCPKCGSSVHIAYQSGDDSVGIWEGIFCFNEVDGVDCDYVDFSWDDHDQYLQEVKEGKREIHYA